MRHSLLTAMVAGLALAAPTAALAQEPPLELRGYVSQPGYINFVLIGPPGSAADIREIVGPSRRTVLTTTIPPVGWTSFWGAARWNCARTSRRFVATNARGEQSYFSLRTPSCRNRIALAAPPRAREGSVVRVRLTDTFGLQPSRARLCVVPPRGRGRCRGVRLPARGRPARMSFRASGRGQWRLVLSAPSQRTIRRVAVGVPVRGRRLPRLFFTGDSMMQSIDNVVADRVADRAETVSDIFAGAALSKTGIIDLVRHTRARVRRLRPAATVIFLGANEGFPLRTAAGAVECCGEAWIAAYAKRVRSLIRAGGKRPILITLPAPRDPERRAIYWAVNEGLRRGVAAERGARLIDLVPVLSPGFIYTDWLPRRGKPLWVRETDGIHVSIDGAPIVSALVIRALERSGAIRRRR